MTDTYKLTCPSCDFTETVESGDGEISPQWNNQKVEGTPSKVKDSARSKAVRIQKKGCRECGGSVALRVKA